MQGIVQVLAGLHVSELSFERALLIELFEHVIDCPHCDSESRDRIDYAIVSVLFELLVSYIRGLSELGHIGKKENILFVSLELFGYKLEFLARGKTFGENHVGASINVQLAAADRFFDAHDSACVGSRADDKGAVRDLFTCFGAKLYFLCKVIRIQELLAIQMTATLGEYLILDVKG